MPSNDPDEARSWTASRRRRRRSPDRGTGSSNSDPDPGFLAQRLLQRLPDVDYTALDFSAAMHELARDRLEPWAAGVTFLERNFKSETWPEGLEPFRLVVANQAVHELRHKRHALGLHRQVLGVLAPRGSYLLSDHFTDPGGLENTELYMKRDEQTTALQDAGFASVERLAVAGTLVLHLARKA